MTANGPGETGELREVGAVPAPELLVDGHVHLHAGYGIEAFLGHAQENLEREALRAGAGPGWIGVLLLTESAGTDRFAELREVAGSRGSVGRWSLDATADEASLWVRRDGAGPIVIMAGRQVRCRSGLEVLALCTLGRFADGGSLQDTAARVREAGGIPAVPWGFGKWWGPRGRIVETAIREAAAGDLLLGDTGLRLRGMGNPPQFDLALERGIAILAGSDPLPFAGQVRRVGSYGSILSANLVGQEWPSQFIRGVLATLRGFPRSFGSREALPGFFWAQTRVRFP